MDWYYKEENRKIGPVTDSEFESLVKQDRINDQTPVWNEIIDRWQPYGEVVRKGADKEPEAGHEMPDLSHQRNAGGQPAEEGVICSQCGNSFSPGEVLSYDGKTICASCKPLYFQRLKEGAGVPGEFVYGGFWIRFVAIVIDGIILGIIDVVLALALMSSTTFSITSAPSGMALGVRLLEYVIAISYFTYFVGSRGATPGKMVFGLKIIRPDGEKVGYGRALGRYFAYILSSLILMIGYIMAAFNSEKKALHDIICDTRVVRT